MAPGVGGGGQQQGEGGGAAGGVEAGGRLVGDQDGRAAQQGAGQGGALPLAPAHDLDRPVRHAERRQQPGRAVAPGRPGAGLAEQDRQQHVLQRRHPGDEVHVLEHKAEPLAPPAVARGGGPGPDVVVAPHDPARRRRLDAGQGVQ